MSRLSLLLVAALVLLCLSFASSQTCGGAGYDLSSLANQQFYYFDGTYAYTAAPCGAITNSSACPCFDTDAPSLCQAYPGYCGGNLARYSPQNSTWYAAADSSSVNQMIQDGDFCEAEGGVNGGDYRESLFVYLCDPTATTPELLNVTEVHTCYYTAYFRTAAACTPTNGALTGPAAGVGSTYFSQECGGGAYDLSSLSSTDLVWDEEPSSSTSGWQWFLRPCGSVTQANCTASAGQGDGSIPAGQTAMLCQASKTDNTDDNAASYYVAPQQLWQITANGVSVSIADGESCGTNFNRQTTVKYVCDATATTAVMTSVVEQPACFYTATVSTNLVCGPPGGVIAPSTSSSSTGSAPASSSSAAAGSSSSAAAISSSSAAASTAAASSASSAASTAAATLSSTSTVAPASSTAAVAPSSTASTTPTSSASSTADVTPSTAASTATPVVLSSTAGPETPIINAAASTSASLLALAALTALAALMC